MGEEFWKRNEFCMYASDWDGPELARVIFVINPENAEEFWTDRGFDDMAAWAKRGFEGIMRSVLDETAFWILSPDSTGG